LQPLQQGTNAAWALVGQRAEVLERIAELLVLGADTPGLRRLAASLEILDELSLPGDDFALALRRSGHALTPRSKWLSARRRPAAGPPVERRLVHDVGVRPPNASWYLFLLRPPMAAF